MTEWLHGARELVRRAYARLRIAVVEHRANDPVLLTLLAGLLLIVAGGAWAAHAVTADLPGNDAVRGIDRMAQATTLLDRNGRAAFTIYQEQRTEVPLTKISPHLIRAILAIEDQRFYDHSGVDLVRIAGAAVRNIRVGRRAQGGSTITQQLARQSFLSPDKTFARKLKEAIVAVRIEREFTKDEILQMYLNKVYFGDGLYGIEAASLGFFGKHAAELDLAEAALLAGLVKSPSAFAPTISRGRALARRAVVLQAMRDAHAIDARAYAAAVRAPLRLQDTLRGSDAFGQYFREEVRRQLVDRFGWERVYQGGLRVYTTIDLDMQKAAEQEVQRALGEIEQRQRRSRRGGPAAGADPLQAALVAYDPLSGEVRAMVGGRDFAQSPFNRATQAHRQPGSAFKPFVYAAALERGYTPATVISNLSAPVQTVQGAWTPEDEHLDSDAITMRAALRTSSNRAAVQMLQEVGIAQTVRYAQRMGVGSVPSVPSLALGSGEVTLLAMTAAFGAFADGGMLYRPTLIRRVETTGGTLLFDGTSRPERVVSEATAFLMTSMLADVINAGTAWKARQEGFTLPAAGKTGTTNDYKDAWFVGYTPALATGVWIGYDQPRTIVAGGYAGDTAVPLWGRFMRAATQHDEPLPFRPPATVTAVEVCSVSGRLPTDACRNALVAGRDGTWSRRSTVYTEYFTRGTEPVDVCTSHGVLGEPTLAAAASPAPGGAAPSPVAGPVITVRDESEAAEAPASTSGTAPTEEPKKKRGFWGRIFRMGQ